VFAVRAGPVHDTDVFVSLTVPALGVEAVAGEMMLVRTRASETGTASRANQRVIEDLPTDGTQRLARRVASPIESTGSSRRLAEFNRWRAAVHYRNVAVTSSGLAAA
jgi:hypothetical protein